ncbi:MAG: hypothetical protein ACRCY3_03885 [Sphingorhabdus sp.]
MSGTPPSANTHQGNRAKIGAAIPQGASNRTPADNGRQSALFQRELEKLGKPGKPEESGETRGKDEMAAKGGKGAIDDQDRRHGSDDNQRHHGELPADFLINAAFRAAKANAMQAPSAPELPAEHLARIAAAIQELVAGGATADYQLQLPLGNAMLQGAVVGRDGGGNLAIQLIASGTLSPQHAAQLRSELLRRMEERRLRVASLAISTGGLHDQRLEQRQKPD